jgi:hypothetical protein
MDLKELQEIWNNQEEEQLFAVNQQALYQTIRRKSRSTRRWLEFLEWLLIGVNLAAAFFLVYDAFQEGGPAFQYVVAAMYIAYGLYALGRRLIRRQAEMRFDETVLGELNKALWQVDQLIRWGRSLPLWYLLPLALAGSLSLILNSTAWWKAALLLLSVPAAYIGVRWEINKWHLPKKRALQSLREQLLAAENEPSSTL